MKRCSRSVNSAIFSSASRLAIDQLDLSIQSPFLFNNKTNFVPGKLLSDSTVPLWYMVVVIHLPVATYARKTILNLIIFLDFSYQPSIRPVFVAKKYTNNSVVRLFALFFIIF